jgi:hypothetical protein
MPQMESVPPASAGGLNGQLSFDESVIHPLRRAVLTSLRTMLRSLPV